MPSQQSSYYILASFCLVLMMATNAFTITSSFAAGRNNSILAKGTRLCSSTTDTSNKVESLTVAGMSDNHDQVGQELAESIQRWLDAEWMPQDVHLQMGLSAKASYVNCRQAGQDDLMLIMTTIVDDLMEDWYTTYDADAFVNAWDISNYASDYLTQKQGIDECKCMVKIH